MFTEEDSKRQDALFAELKEEFARLEQQEQELRKAAGTPEDQEIKESDLSPEVRQALEEAKAKAKRDGEARATQFANGTATHQNQTGSPIPGQRRQGIVRI